MAKYKTIGILGGTFDPIHFGHLNIAKFCQQEFNLDEVIFIPCHVPSHRPTPQANIEQRLEMLQLAISNETTFSYNDFEMQSSAESYSFNTLKYLRNKYPEHSICFILGMDSFENFNTWQNYSEILNLCNLIIVNRPGYKLPETNWSKQLLEQHLCDDHNQATEFHNGKAFSVKVTPQHISATQIRNQLKQQSGDIINVPDEVKNYMDKHNLYQNDNNTTFMININTVQELLEEQKAEDVKIIDVKNLTNITDYMIICTARSSRHASAIGNNLTEKLREQGFKPISIEGEKQSDWILLDYADFVVHIMLKETREFYSLEKLWSVTNGSREQAE